MESLNNKLELLSKHLKALDKTFLTKSNYSELDDYEKYKFNHDEFERLAKDSTIKYSKYKISNSSKQAKKLDLSFADEIYHQNERQMKLADIIEYFFFSRGIYYIFQSNSFRPDRISIFLKLILRYVNLLMIFENVTVDSKLRIALIDNLKNIIEKEVGYEELRNWYDIVGLPQKHSKQKGESPDLYFDSLLPKTAGGLWHEMLVFAFILKYDIGYIFPLLLTQKPISLEEKLSPPDLIILHKGTYRYYGIEIGNLKERQSGGFMAPSGIAVIPIDTLNARISDRCPSCDKWICICEKVIDVFSDTSQKEIEPINEIRCLVDCNKYTLEEKISGKCPSIKFKCKNISKKIGGKKFNFIDGKHHHYKCCIKRDKNIIEAIKSNTKYDDLIKFNLLLTKTELTDEETKWKNNNYETLRRTFNYLKTHSVFYSELTKLIKIKNTTTKNAK